MSKYLCSALVLGSMVLASTAFADNSAKTTDTDLAPGYSARMAKAKKTLMISWFALMMLLLI